MEQSIYKNELIGGEFNLRKIGDENLRINTKIFSSHFYASLLFTSHAGRYELADCKGKGKGDFT